MTTPMLPLLGDVGAVVARRAGGPLSDDPYASQRATPGAQSKPTNLSGASPYYRRYLDDQAKSIRARGGDDTAVNHFLDLEEGKAFGGQVTGPTVEDFAGPDNTPTYLRGVSMALVQGATFGFGDEAAGAILGIATGVGARRGIDDYRKEYTTWAKENHKAALAAEIAGGFLVPIGGVAAGAAKDGGVATRALVGASRAMLPKAGAGAAGLAFAGAKAGAEYGVGNAEGGIGDRTLGALTGSVVGAATGGTLGALGSWVVAPAVEHIAASTIGKAVLRPIERKLAQTFGSEVLALTPEPHAHQRLAKALLSENIDFDVLEQRLVDLHRSGVSASVLDAGGDELLALANGVLKDRSPLTTTIIQELQARQTGEGQRLVAALLGQATKRGNRFGMANATEAADLLHAKGLADSEQFYNSAHEQVVKLTPRLRKLLDQPDIKKAYNLGAQLAQKQDLAGTGHGLPVKELADDVAELMRKAGLSEAAIARTADASSNYELPIRGIDYLQRGLRRIINQGFKTGELAAEDAKALLSMRDELVGEARNQSKDFAKAQSLYSGPVKSRDAIKLGRKFLRMEPAAIRKAIARVAPNDRDFARLGYVQDVYNTITKPGSDNVAKSFFGGNLFGTKSFRLEQVHALFPDAPEAAEAFARTLAGETRASYTVGRAVSLPASTTVEKLEQQAVGDLPHGAGSTGLVVSAGRKILRRFRAVTSKDEADELTHLFGKGLRRAEDGTDTGVLPRELRVLLDDLHYSYSGVAAKQATRKVVARVAGQKPGAIANAALDFVLR